MMFQCAVKVVESLEAKEFLEEIRLVLIEIKPNECCVKYKTILNALTVRDVSFSEILKENKKRKFAIKTI